MGTSGWLVILGVIGLAVVGTVYSALYYNLIRWPWKAVADTLESWS